MSRHARAIYDNERFRAAHNHITIRGMVFFTTLIYRVCYEILSRVLILRLHTVRSSIKYT